MLPVVARVDLSTPALQVLAMDTLQLAAVATRVRRCADQSDVYVDVVESVGGDGRHERSGDLPLGWSCDDYGAHRISYRRYHDHRVGAPTGRRWTLALTTPADLPR